jgi:hypothetical protein
MSWDVMVRSGLNPTNTTAEDLFRYIGERKLGYRIVINNWPNGQDAPAWDVAVANGMMVFAAHFNNTPNYRFDDPIGIKSAVSVGGGGPAGNVLTYGQSLEFHDALPVGWHGNRDAEDPAQSWANQMVAAKFARVLDTHPEYSIWDARQHLRQAGNRWRNGWTEKEGYGWVDEKAVIGKLQPGAPLSFRAVVSRDRMHVNFSWQNFLMTDFAATVIAKANGQVIYQGTGSNFVWRTDTEGDVTFRYWSRNKAGERSRHESCHERRVSRLLLPDRNYTALILGMPLPNNSLEEQVREHFLAVATNWICDTVVPPGSPFFDSMTNFPVGNVLGVVPGYAAMVSYTITNHYRIVIVPALPVARTDLEALRPEWDRAAAAGVLVVLPRQTFRDVGSRTNRVVPSRLGSAVTVGPALPGDMRSQGPGVEFIELVPRGTDTNSPHAVNLCAARVAGRLANLLEQNPGYSSWDARQHLRQISSHYAGGWRESGGYGIPPTRLPLAASQLDAAPPLHFHAEPSVDRRSVSFTWEPFPQSDFAEVILSRASGEEIYRGTANRFVWRSNLTGASEFTLQAKSKAGAISRIEDYTRLRVTGLAANP